MIKIEFPADRTDIAHAIGEALCSLRDAAPQDDSDDEDTPLEVVGQNHDETVYASGPLEVDVRLHAIGEYDTPDDITRSGKIDENKVEFNSEFCGQAKIPFYASGKKSGQWKRRGGVDEAAYDEWYAGELAKVREGTVLTRDELDDLQVAAAFGGQPDTTAVTVPKTCGEFMGWVSEMQVAGHLTQEDVNAAYQTEGLEVMCLFPPNTDAQVKERCAALHKILAVRAGL